MCVGQRWAYSVWCTLHASRCTVHRAECMMDDAQRQRVSLSPPLLNNAPTTTTTIDPLIFHNTRRLRGPWHVITGGRDVSDGVEDPVPDQDLHAAVRTTDTPQHTHCGHHTRTTTRTTITMTTTTPTHSGNHETRDVNGWEEHYEERSFIRQVRNPTATPSTPSQFITRISV